MWPTLCVALLPVFFSFLWLIHCVLSSFAIGRPVRGPTHTNEAFTLHIHRFFISIWSPNKCNKLRLTFSLYARHLFRPDSIFQMTDWNSIQNACFFLSVRRHCAVPCISIVSRQPFRMSFFIIVIVRTLCSHCGQFFFFLPYLSAL